MGKKYLIDEATLTDISDGIRETINDLDAKYKPEDMRKKINDVYNTGEEDGFNYGYATGLDEGWELGSHSGYNAGYLVGEENGIELGKQTEWSDFWDVFQNYGKMKKYDSVFRNVDYLDYNSWRKETLRPKYDIIPTSADRMFYGVKGITDLGEHFRELGVKLDFSQSTTLFSCFCYGEWVTLPIIDASNAIGNGIGGMCNYCYSLETIEKLIVSEKTKAVSTPFVSCNKLKNIVIEGVIPISLSFVHSPLTRESALSVINHLKDISGTGTTLTVTFSATTKALLTDEDKAIATQKGWTIA